MGLLQGTLLRGSISPRVPLILTPIKAPYPPAKELDAQGTTPDVVCFGAAVSACEKAKFGIGGSFSMKQTVF